MPSRTPRHLVTLVSTLAVALGQAGPGEAWKPKTHIYLAEEAMRDALDDGLVTIREVDPATGRVLGVLGHFPVDPKIVRALRTAPRQYRAGVVGPDAFPDIVTGQTVIHPEVAAAIDGAAGGSNAWLTHLWQRGFVDSEVPEVNAFVVGYLTHAAGDVFAHTFVNHYSGGEFTMAPDPSNAIKHLVFEGYLGKRTPATMAAVATSVSTRTGICNRRKAEDLGLEQDCSSKTAPVVLPISGADTSIAGVERFIHDDMTQVAPGGVLADKLYRGDGTTRSIPFIFSTLRTGLAREVAAYDRQRMELRGPARVAFSSANGPAAEYKRAWIGDIDRGLLALPEFSQSLSQAIVYNEGGADTAAAKTAADVYVRDHLASMIGVPDAAVMTAAAIGAVTERLLPPPLREAMGQLARAPVDMLVTAATGMTPQQLADHLTYPERYFDKVMTTSRGASGGGVPHPVTLTELNHGVLKLADAGYADPAQRWSVDAVPAAFNTVQLTKMLMLSPAGYAALKAKLAERGATIDVPARNAMLGWVTSLDHGNQWQGAGTGGARPIFTRYGDAARTRLFMSITGEAPLAAQPSHGAIGPTSHAATPAATDWPTLPTPTETPAQSNGGWGQLPPSPTPAPAPTNGGWGQLPSSSTTAGRATGTAAPGTVAEAAPGTDIGGGFLALNEAWAAHVDRFVRAPDGSLQVFLTIRNLRDDAYYFSPGSVRPVIHNADGEGLMQRGIYRTSEPPSEFSPQVAARGEVRIRLIFTPAKGFGRAVRLTIEGDSSRPTGKPVAWAVPADVALPR